MLINTDDLHSKSALKKYIDEKGHIVNVAKKTRIINKKDWFVFDCGNIKRQSNYSKSVEKIMSAVEKK